MSKLTTLSQLKTSMEASKVYIDAQDASLSARIDAAVQDIEGIVATGGEANILEGVKVNGAALAITDKMVDILIASGEENGTISVNGAAVAITGLAALAYKSEITEDELSEALKASIAAKATQADLEALTVRVGDIESAGYQTAEQVSAAIQTAIADSGHAHFEVAETDPTAEGFEAAENVMYLYMNETTGHYDIYALVGESVVLIDDTTVDLSNYYTKEQADAAIAAAVAALNVDQYATDEELQAVIVDVAAIQTALANVYTKAEIDAKFEQAAADVDTKLEGYATDEEAQTAAETAAAAAVAANTATDEEVTAAIGEVFGSET